MLLISLLSYLHTCFIRSYRFGPPSFIFLAGIVFIYSVVPNPVMESYSFSVSFLFIISTMLSYAIIDNETMNQEAISIIHTGNIRTLYIAKLLYSWLFTVPFAIVALLYPALTYKFDRAPSITELLMSLLYHLSASWLAVAITCWFCTKFIRSRLTSFLLLTLVVVVAFSAQSINNLLPSAIQYVTILFPPVNAMMDVLYNYENHALGMKWMPIGVTLLYSFASSALFLIILNRKKQDSPT